MFSKTSCERPLCPGNRKPTVGDSMSGRDLLSAQIELRQKEREVEQLRKKFQEKKQ
ncbi:hypothetical protein CHARACLAT_030873, partial [Characodon lateralis]|nr:hypothetical protein [Characodon lateralis]